MTSRIPADLEHNLWSRLAQATGVEDYCQSWLGIEARLIQGVTCGLVVLGKDAGSGFRTVALWPGEASRASELSGVIERAIREGKGMVVRHEPANAAGGTDGAPEGDDAAAGADVAAQAHYHIAYPVAINGDVHGAAALQITLRPQIELQATMRQLQWGAAWLQNWVLRHSAPEGEGPRRIRTALDLTALTLQEERFRPAATSFVTDLATRLQCDRVCIGFSERKQVRVRAMSHSAQFGKQMNLIRAIGSAMAEAVDQGDILVYPDPDPKSARVLHAHERLAREHGDRAICTIPLHRPGGEAFGALVLERSAAEPFDRATIDLCDSVAALAGPILDAKRRDDRLLVTKIGDSLWKQVLKLTGPRHAIAKLSAAGCLLLALFFAFARGDYRVTARTALEGEVQRVIAAPFRGFIAEAPVRAGDIVREGQVICTLDDRDLRVEYSRVSGEREQYVVEHRRAMAGSDLAAMNVLSKKMQQADAQLELLREQLARTRIVAPFDGLMVSGDLSQALGAPVDAGQVLFEVAPLASYRVVLRVDESDIDEIREGQAGELVLTALPSGKLPLRVTKVTPVSMPEEGRNLFNVEAMLLKISPRLRPGMEGFGKITIDRRHLIWIWTHRMIDWVRLKIWAWVP